MPESPAMHDGIAMDPLEHALAAGLRRVPAPSSLSAEALWGALETARRSEALQDAGRRCEPARRSPAGNARLTGIAGALWGRSFVRGLVWASVVAALMAAWGLRSDVALRNRAGVAEGLAARAAAQTGPVEFRSSEGAQVRAWISREARLDVPLPAQTPEAVALAGADIIGRSGRDPVAEVEFRVNGNRAALLVTPGGSAMGSGGFSAGPHRFLTGEPAAAAPKTGSWLMNGQIYALACDSPRGFREACVLCHA